MGCGDNQNSVRRRRMIQSNFFNTINERGEELINSKKVCAEQEIKIMKIFDIHKYLSPSQVYFFFANRNVPLTSIRRGITNLTNQGKLKKTEVKVMGSYGKKEHIWILIP
jgi:hypothetical protein